MKFSAFVVTVLALVAAVQAGKILVPEPVHPSSQAIIDAVGVKENAGTLFPVTKVPAANNMEATLRNLLAGGANGNGNAYSHVIIGPEQTALATALAGDFPVVTFVTLHPAAVHRPKIVRHSNIAVFTPNFFELGDLAGTLVGYVTLDATVGYLTTASITDEDALAWQGGFAGGVLASCPACEVRGYYSSQQDLGANIQKLKNSGVTTVGTFGTESMKAAMSQFTLIASSAAFDNALNEHPSIVKHVFYRLEVSAAAFIVGETPHTEVTYRTRGIIIEDNSRSTVHLSRKHEGAFALKLNELTTTPVIGMYTGNGGVYNYTGMQIGSLGASSINITEPRLVASPNNIVVVVAANLDKMITIIPASRTAQSATLTHNFGSVSKFSMAPHPFDAEKAIIYGGLRDSNGRRDFLSMTLELNYRTATISELSASAPELLSRHSHTSLTHADKVYVLGGIGSGLKVFGDLWALSFSGNSNLAWESVSALGKPRFDHASTVWIPRKPFRGLPAGSPWIVVYGGQEFPLLSDLQFYSIDTNVWFTPPEPSPSPGQLYSPCLIAQNDFITVVGGKSEALTKHSRFNILNPFTNVWESSNVYSPFVEASLACTTLMPSGYLNVENEHIGDDVYDSVGRYNTIAISRGTAGVDVISETMFITVPSVSCNTSNNLVMNSSGAHCMECPTGSAAFTDGACYICDAPEVIGHPLCQTATSSSTTLIVVVVVVVVVAVVIIIIGAVLFHRYEQYTESLIENAPRDTPLTLCNIDVEDSSQRWRAAPKAMRKIMEAHVKVVRKSIAKHKGFEVTSVDDAIVVATKDPATMLAIALDVVRLSRQIPPVENLQRVAVRIGIHHCSPEIKIDQQEGIVEYLGNDASVASLLARMAENDTILISRQACGVIPGLDEMVDGFDMADKGYMKLHGQERSIDVVSVTAQKGDFSPIVCPPMPVDIEVSQGIKELTEKYGQIPDTMVAGPHTLVDSASMTEEEYQHTIELTTACVIGLLHPLTTREQRDTLRLLCDHFGVLTDAVTEKYTACGIALRVLQTVDVMEMRILLNRRDTSSSDSEAVT